MSPDSHTLSTEHWLATYILGTSDDWALTIVRCTLGIVYFPHGAQKLLGWFGGRGFGGTISLYQQLYHLPVELIILAIAAESLGSVALICGFFARIAAFGIAVDMAVAIKLVTFNNGFFMNWTGRQTGEGIEFQLLVIGMSIALVLAGPGSFSIDGILARHLRSRKEGSRSNTPNTGHLPSSS